MKTLVVGLGNPILTDDGVGVKVAYAVEHALQSGAQGEPAADEITVTEACVGGLRLMELMVGYGRAIIVDARKRKLGTEDYPGSLKLSQDFVAPTLRIIRASENSHHLHSELVSRMGEWVPECMAYLVASNGPETELDTEQLREIERDLADRVVVLMQSVLQMAITRRGPLYEPEALRARMQPVLELAEVILQKN